MSKPIAITDVDQVVREAVLPVVVDFWAPWCRPCHAIAPHLEALAEQYDGRLAIAKVNVDEHPELQAQFGVFGLPTIVIFKDGTEAGRIIGAQPRRHLQQAFDEALARS
jgi:thioredoxin 1